MEKSPTNIKTLIAETLTLKNLNQERFSQITGVPKRYLEAIQNAEIDKLPPLPYVRGYIRKIAEALQLDPDELWELYKKELRPKTSGIFDRLPSNRFAIKRISKKNQSLIVLGLLLFLYFALNLERLRGEPDLIVTNPAAPVVTAFTNNIRLVGQLRQQDKLTINGEEIFVNSNKTFSKDYSLQPGLNTVEFKAKRFLGKEKIIIRQILYQPQVGQ